jgi:hypothetical protein
MTDEHNSKSPTNQKPFPRWAIYVLLGLFVYGLLAFAFTMFTKSAEKRSTNNTSAQEKVSVAPTLTPEPHTETDAELQNLITQMNSGGDKTGSAYVKTDDGHMQALKQDDGTWLVTRIQNSWPEMFAETGVKSMSYAFIRDIYASGLPIKQAGMTIGSTNGNYYRVFLGANQANEKTEWQSYGPTNFYKWVKSVETDVDQPRENRTIIEENI